ncbi:MULTISPECIES: hypothetical protein [Lacrimispora]|uniref:Uncharacterized protein n=1 Tax=Lacrimispora xylanolytica TaxID=29375 RepID=A0ABY7AFV8_9FIRM|nr:MULTISPECIES: hypothetical protein [Lacrimispora]WAJ25264.1 hypothetical protein OW255_07080 [Lacrimispora xylanolytica]
MDNHMLICQIRNKRDLEPFVSGVIETGEHNIIILHLKEDCFSDISGSDFLEIKKVLFDPYIISVLVIDCEFSMSLCEKLYVFDLCFLCEKGAMRYDPKHLRGVHFLKLLFAPKASFGKEARIMNCEELINHGFANTILRNESFYKELETEMLNLTLERTKEQLHGIKSCMNAYKDCCLSGTILTTDPETGYFCKLALIKTEEDTK